MNNEIEKGIVKQKREKEKKEHPNSIKKWWRKNDYKVNRIIFFPIWIPIKISKKITTYLNKKEVWSEERAQEILNYYIPYSADWNEEEKTFYYFNNGYGWDIYFSKKYLKFKDRRFWKVHTGLSRELRDYLIEKYELEGFKKIIKNTSDGWTEILFEKIEK